MSRSSELLKAAADALEEGSDPFHESFLGKHDVTADECFDLADSIAMGARLVAWATENPRQAAAFAASGSAGMAMETITKAIAKINLSGKADHDSR